MEEEEEDGKGEDMRAGVIGKRVGVNEAAAAEEEEDDDAAASAVVCLLDA